MGEEGGGAPIPPQLLTLAIAAARLPQPPTRLPLQEKRTQTA